MKILALSFLFPNSRMPNHGIFVWNRLKALSKYVEVKVINPVPWSPMHRFLDGYRTYGEVPSREIIGGLEVFHPRFFSIPGILKSIEATTYSASVAAVVAELASSYSFDVIDMHWTYPDLPAGLRLARRYGKPSIVTLRGREAFYMEDGGKRATLIHQGLRAVDQIVALSQELADLSTSLIGSNEKTHVIRNGVDASGFGFIPRSQARARLGLAQEGRIILMVGSLIRRKGFDLVIDALYGLKDHDLLNDARLYIVGSEGPEGDYRAALFRQVRELGLDEQVIFVGSVMNSQLPLWYCAADVFCLASRGEGSPNVLTEALACGCPCIATDVGAVREIMECEPDLGICVPPENTAALGQALMTMLRTEHPREQIAAGMRKYDWDWCARQVMEVYRETLGRHGCGGTIGG